MKATRNAAAKWLDKAPKAALHYKAGVCNPRREPEHPYPQDKLATGTRNYLAGMFSGADRYRRAWRHFRKALLRVVLPPRYPNNDARNHLRVIAVCAALHQEKVRRMTQKQRAKHNPRGCSLCEVKVTRKQ